MVVDRVVVRHCDAVPQCLADPLEFGSSGDEAPGRRWHEPRIRCWDAIEGAPETPDKRWEAGLRWQMKIAVTECAMPTKEHDNGIDPFGVVAGFRQHIPNRPNERVHGRKRFEEAEAPVVQRAATKECVAKLTA